MAEYKAIEMFKDLKTGILYNPGDTYTGDRAEELSGSENKLKRPLIAAAQTEAEEPVKPKAKGKKAKANG